MNRVWPRVARSVSLINGGQSDIPEKELRICMPAIILWGEQGKHRENK